MVLLEAYLETNVFILFEKETIYPKNVVVKTTFKSEPGGVSDRMLFAYVSQFLLQRSREFCLRKDEITSVVKGHLCNPLKRGLLLQKHHQF
jgi:hypothetical protein